MKALAALALALTLWSCGGGPMGLSAPKDRYDTGTQVDVITLKSGERLRLRAGATVTEIEGDLVKFSDGTTVDFSNVAAWE